MGRKASGWVNGVCVCVRRGEAGIERETRTDEEPGVGRKEGIGSHR